MDTRLFPGGSAAECSEMRGTVHLAIFTRRPSSGSWGLTVTVRLFLFFFFVLTAEGTIREPFFWDDNSRTSGLDDR